MTIDINTHIGPPKYNTSLLVAVSRNCPTIGLNGT